MPLGPSYGGIGGEEVDAGDITGSLKINTKRVAVDTTTDGTVSAWEMTDTSIPRTFTIGTVDEVLDTILTFADGSLAAGTNNITITTESGSLIDGQASLSIAVNGGGMSFKFDGTNWKELP